MTKYILNSGGLKNFPEKDIKFSQEIIKNLGKTPRILFCYFAIPKEYWEEKFTRHAGHFLELIDKDIKPKFELALPEKFSDQIKNNDAVIINGGGDELLLDHLKQYNLPELWEGKVVAGSSAGSDALVEQFWACDRRLVMNGLGILPIKFISHYKSSYGEDDSRGPINWERAYKELSDSNDQSLPIHALEEGDFIIIEK